MRSSILLFSRVLLTLGLFCITLPIAAQPQWQSFTLDNDIFVGNDNGYTNGLYYSWYNFNDANNLEESMAQVNPGWLSSAISWTLPKNGTSIGLNAYTIGQSMITPSDITTPDPDENEIPYSGFLFLNNTYLAINDTYADKISATIGIVGPSSGAESIQDKFHQLFDADDPKGWDTQLEDELVFQFSRGRAWRTWSSEDGHLDFITGGEVSVGTLESSLATGMMFRYGRNMKNSFAVPLLTSSRTTNPVAVEGSWYLYAGVGASYVGNIIFADGNTFRDSRSTDYDPFQLSVSFGLAYSWQDFSITFAFSDIDLNINNTDESLDEMTRYGTLTFVWRG